MKTAIVLGANGLVGQELVKQLTENPNYQQIQVLGRRKLALIHDKINYHSFDFNQPNSSLLMGDVLFCCLGTTIKKAGSQSEFRKVDFEYVIQSAKIAFGNGTKSMVVITAMGADAQSSIFYNKVKGEVEKELSSIGFDKLVIVRPSLLLGNRSEFRFGERVAQVCVRFINFLIPTKYKGIKAEQVAKAMIHYESKSSQPVAIYENQQLLSF